MEAISDADDLVTRIKDTIEARYLRGHEDGYTAALHELVSHIAGKLGVTVEPEASEPKPAEPDSAAPESAAAANGPTALSDLPAHLQRAYERLKTTPGITSRIASKQWGGNNAVLYQLHKAGLAEKRGTQFYAVER